MKILLSCLLLAAVALLAFKQLGDGKGPVPAAQRQAPPPEEKMKQYWLVFLLKGPNRTHAKAEAEKIQAAHIANIERLAAEKKIIMAGPMGYDRDLRGIFIMDAKDSTEAASYVRSDSAVLTGRLRFEVHPWWTMTGKYEFK